MIQTTYRDLAEFGLPLRAAGDPAFHTRVEEIRKRPGPFLPDIDGESEPAAVLENQSGKAVIILGYLWQYTTTGGEIRTNRNLNLGSSRQMDVLTGRETVSRDLGSFISPGSSRLITEDGMFGDNRDVLGPPPAAGGGGWAFGRGYGARKRFPEQIAALELRLDVAIFEDGLCAGPDELGLMESLTERMQRQRDTAREIVRELQEGASPGRIFEMLRPLARRPYAGPPKPGSLRDGHTPLLSMFVHSAVNHLINMDGERLLKWFEAAADISPMRIHRPS
jgi:hypothetical protein